MPGKGRGFTSKDYQAPLRKPGEKLETAVAQNDGAQKPASASDESEKGGTVFGINIHEMFSWSCR